jgi:hypothetical protein
MNSGKQGFMTIKTVALLVGLVVASVDLAKAVFFFQAALDSERLEK